MGAKGRFLVRRVRRPSDRDAPWIRTADYAIRQRTITTASAALQLCAADPARVALLVGSPASANGVQVSLTPGFTLGNGMVVGTQYPWQLIWSEVGPLCQQAWYGIVGSGAGTCLVTEVRKLR